MQLQMTQETGNSIQQLKSLSILIHTGGLSFYVSDGKSVIQNITVPSNNANIEENIRDVISSIFNTTGEIEQVTVIVSTTRYSTIPEELYNEANCNIYLEAKGIVVDPNADTIVSSTHNGIVYIWCIKQLLIDTLKDFFQMIRFIHPLQISGIIQSAFPATDVVIVEHTGNHLTLSLYKEEQLIFHEVLKVLSQSDIIYYLSSIVTHANYTSIPEIISIGNEAATLAETLKTIFPKVTTLPFPTYLYKTNALCEL